MRTGIHKLCMLRTGGEKHKLNDKVSLPFVYCNRKMMPLCPALLDRDEQEQNWSCCPLQTVCFHLLNEKRNPFPIGTTSFFLHIIPSVYVTKTIIVHIVNVNTHWQVTAADMEIIIMQYVYYMCIPWSMKCQQCIDSPYMDSNIFRGTSSL